MQQVLLIGCGSNRDRKVPVNGKYDFVDQKVTTIDIEPSHSPDITWDLNETPWSDLKQPGFESTGRFHRIPDCSFDEVHAYEVLEHLGQQGDVRAFFEVFYEIWRVLKPGGYLAATVPAWQSLWAWGDPSHTRVINEGSLVFLDQNAYKGQVGKSPMSDYRSIWRGDFFLEKPGDLYYVRDRETNRPTNMVFVLKAQKPAR